MVELDSQIAPRERTGLIGYCKYQRCTNRAHGIGFAFCADHEAQLFKGSAMRTITRFYFSPGMDQVIYPPEQGVFMHARAMSRTSIEIFFDCQNMCAGYTKARRFICENIDFASGIHDNAKFIGACDYIETMGFTSKTTFAIYELAL